MEFLLAIGVILGILGIDFLISVGTYRILCWCFGFIFSWKFAIAFWLILALLQSIFKPKKGDK